MIGTESFLLELMPLLVPLIFIVAGVRIWLKERRFLGLVITAFASIMMVEMGIRYFHQASNHQYLANLTAADIKSIRVGDTTITDPAHIAPITTSLNDCQWFSSDHGGWADTVDLIVTPKHGDAHRYWIGYYLRKHGIVIKFYRGDKHAYSADGYAFSATLPESLARAGVKIPEQP